MDPYTDTSWQDFFECFLFYLIFLLTGLNGGLVVGVALLFQSEKALIRIPSGTFLCRVCMFSPCLCGVFPGISGVLP